MSILTSIPKPGSEETLIIPSFKFKGLFNKSLLNGWLDWSYSKIGERAKIEWWVVGIEAITWIEAAWAIEDPHTCGLTSIPKLWARFIICLAAVMPPQEPISGWAISTAPFSNKFLNPKRVCSFSPPAIGVCNWDLNST